MRRVAHRFLEHAREVELAHAHFGGEVADADGLGDALLDEAKHLLQLVRSEPAPLPFRHRRGGGIAGNCRFDVQSCPFLRAG